MSEYYNQERNQGESGSYQGNFSHMDQTTLADHENNTLSFVGGGGQYGRQQGRVHVHVWFFSK